MSAKESRLQKLRTARIILRRKVGDAQYELVVYLVVNKINGKCYVGSTKFAMQTRRAQHEYAALLKKKSGCPVFYKALRRYGAEAFSWFIIDSAPYEEKLRERETHWLQQLEPEYNLATVGWGGNGGNFTKEGLANISRASLGNTYMLGKTHSQETRNRLRQYMLDNPEHWEQYRPLGPAVMRKAVLQISTGIVFNSCKEASAQTKQPLVEIKKSCWSTAEQRHFRFLTKEECIERALPHNASHSWSEERKAAFKKAGASWKCRSVVVLSTRACYPSVADAKKALLGTKGHRGRLRSNRRPLPLNAFYLCGHAVSYLRAA